MENTTYAPVVRELIELITTNKWERKFQQALESVKQYHIETMEELNSLPDYYV